MHTTYENEDFSLLLASDGELFLKYLFDKYYRELCKLSFRYVGRVDVAEDLVQDVFINTWNKRHTLEYKGVIKPCLIRSVINISINYIKSKYARMNIEDESKLVNYNSEIQLQENIEGKELEQLLEIAITQLPDKCREIFSMSRLSGLSHKEIAEQLDISTKTIEAQISIALKRIHQLLKKMGYFSIFFSF
jgi:RNA polymerase sigma-70 factor, ECF subfamily